VGTDDSDIAYDFKEEERGPRVVAGIEILAALLHPDAFPHIPLIGRAARWP
jgi:hypothetical protein